MTHVDPAMGVAARGRVPGASSSGPHRRLVRRWLLHGGALLALLLPALVGIFDHHGLERLPTHGHLSWMDGVQVTSTDTTHAHGFEQDHQHTATTRPRLLITPPTTSLLLTAAPSSAPATESLLPLVVLLALGYIMLQPGAFGTGGPGARRPQRVDSPPLLPPR